MALRILVAGCGSIGQRHLRNLQTLNPAELVGVEPDGLRREAVGKELGISIHGSLKEALQHGADVVFVTAPTAFHIPLAWEAARAGCHLFIEKPLSHTLDGVPELVDFVKRHGRVGFVGSNWKFHHSFRTIKSLLEKETIGRITSARCQFGQYLPDWHPWEDYRKGYSARKDLGGGILLDSHEFDLMTWLLGPAESVFCAMGRLSSLEIETEDTVAATLRFRSGAIGEIHLDYTQRAYQRNLELHGEEGTIKWDIHDKAVRLYRASSKTWEVFEEPVGYGLNNMYLEEVRHFLQCVENRQLPLTPLEVGADVLRLQLAAQRSSTERREVSV
jgi:predicted dehydrogenase